MADTFDSCDMTDLQALEAEINSCTPTELASLAVTLGSTIAREKLEIFKFENYIKSLRKSHPAISRNRPLGSNWVRATQAENFSDRLRVRSYMWYLRPHI